MCYSEPQYKVGVVGRGGDGVGVALVGAFGPSAGGIGSLVVRHVAGDQSLEPYRVVDLEVPRGVEQITDLPLRMRVEQQIVGFGHDDRSLGSRV